MPAVGFRAPRRGGRERARTEQPMPTTAEREAAVFMMSAGRLPLTLVRGEGTKVWDDEGNEYLDFVAGIASDALGHSHPAVVGAAREQIGTLTHVSNYFYTLPQLDLAERVLRLSGMHRIFFVNSGAEATEGAIKIGRKWGRTRRDGATEIIATTESFHGRTLASVSATGTPRYSEPFGPVEGFRHVPFNDADAVRAAVGPQTAAVLVEPLQGEGGVNVADPGYLRALREICDEHDLLLMLDEVQTGIGRTGKMFAFQHEGVTPDVMALAKGLGSGVPIGAIVASERGDILEPGDHGSTFGGQPFTTAVADAVVRTVEEEDLPAKAAERGAQLLDGIRGLQDTHGVIDSARGMGLLCAVQFNSDIGPALVAACRERGLICNVVKPNVLRLVPPLTVSADEIDAAVGIIGDALASLD